VRPFLPIQARNVKRELIADLMCPYCGGEFRTSRDVDGDGDRIRYGLVRCRCFEFPIVDGILLLSLAKGYGGSEERLQPYVPLQVAAIRYLARDDVAGLRGWIKRHLPLADDLIERRIPSYLEFRKRMRAEYDRVVEQELASYARFELPGASAARGLRSRARSLWRRRRTWAPSSALPTAKWLLRDYYASRFFAPRINTLALQLERLPMRAQVLSLCCGHGVFENLLRVQARGASVVSVDAQLINLLVTRDFAADTGSFICHDLQFPLPFRSGYFGGVFSSTCLPEIPPQRSFVQESLRVTGESGWCFFDQIWSLQPPIIQRVDTDRHYRFCQNFFEKLTDYLPFFQECANGRRIAVDVPDMTSRYLENDHWHFDLSEAEAALRGDSDLTMGVLAIFEERFEGFVAPDRRWLRADAMRMSPLFESAAAPEGSGRHALRRGAEPPWQPSFAPKCFPGFPAEVRLDPHKLDDERYLTGLFCDGIAVPLPARFETSIPTLGELRAPDRKSAP
jgi:hypothetical protein